MHTEIHYSVLFLLRLRNNIGGKKGAKSSVYDYFRHPASVDFGLKMLSTHLHKGLSLKSSQLAEYLKGINPIDISVFFLK